MVRSVRPSMYTILGLVRLSRAHLSTRNQKRLALVEVKVQRWRLGMRLALFVQCIGER